ncbi:TetR family transcriptional regulator [Sphingobacterium mizutaii NBRC 14946 = DSM 11724]|uniref:Fatty acid metabolism regulator protein n=2 Tax=Sphingobacterium mizutaii TaxID=1010 RepID=A0AAJ4XBA1_9SPHI|nr:TetR/AcrR family transcriptional regulator [Sphingobacterium mizutaii]GEM68825.1 TetR family transcriptional regulator [Sphingobacterium mizutaii NBRC 14946 = DSM 11724]SDL01424.1 DNA-binding transcriptional regulator, AcrR family [Sphingobacterium mizutaii]SNV50121.1 Fatty acid metabolism regulator protein [Sphingobacterium mizutaii]
MKIEGYTDRQVEIIEAATRRIDQYGIQNLTIKNLASDINVTEPALYRHFKSKNDILMSLLNYFITRMENRISSISLNKEKSPSENLIDLFNFQFKTFTERPAVVSVIFAENIFHFDEGLSLKVSQILELMQGYVEKNIVKGQLNGDFSKQIHPSTLSTILLGGIRLTVLKWKLSGNKTDLIKDGKDVVNGVLKMIKTK